MVESVVEQDPFSGHLFLFRNRQRDRLKTLYWEGDGLALLAQALGARSLSVPCGRDVRLWPRASALVRNTGDELAMLLGGIDLANVKRRNRYERQIA